MTSRIHVDLTQILVTQPETGMGYQVAEITHPGRPGLPARHVLIANGTHFIRFLGAPRYVGEAGARDARLLEVELRQLPHELRVRALSRAEALTRGLYEPREHGGAGAKENPIEDSRPGEAFLRFSAYLEDPRIRPDGSVSDGTYVTTREDGNHVKTGAEAVERYALPNSEPAVYRFHLEPPKQVKVRRGTVRPAFGHAGGGEEAIFEEGAPAGTHRPQHDKHLPRGDE